MGQVIWTNHLYERVRQRGLDPRWVDNAVRFPDKIIPSSTTNSNKHVKVVNGFEIVAAVKRQGSDWIITSAWWKPVWGQTGGRTHPSQSQKKFFLERWIEKGLDALENWVTKKRS